MIISQQKQEVNDVEKYFSFFQCRYKNDGQRVLCPLQSRYKIVNSVCYASDGSQNIIKQIAIIVILCFIGCSSRRQSLETFVTKRIFHSASRSPTKELNKMQGTKKKDRNKMFQQRLKYSFENKKATHQHIVPNQVNKLWKHTCRTWQHSQLRHWNVARTCQIWSQQV